MGQTKLLKMASTETLSHTKTEAMLKVLRDPELAQQYSTGAYDSSERYSEENVWQAWRSLLDDAERVWPAKLAAMPAHAHDAK